MDKAIKCPYCGGLMFKKSVLNLMHWWSCPTCSANSPTSDTRDGSVEKALHITDGYHTFDELYDHRAKLFSVIVNLFPKRSWKSKLHHDGTMYDGMFIVGIDTPNGQASYHYDIDPYWNLFDCRVLEKAPVWDGHTSAEAIERIANMGKRPCGHCEHSYWGDPECRACNADNAFMYYQKRTSGGAK